MLSAIVMLSLLRNSKNDKTQKKEHIRPGPGLRFVSIYMRTVQTQTGMKVTRLGPETKSDQSDFIFRPVSCKCKKRNVWRPIRTHAGLSLSHVNTPLDIFLINFT